LKIVLIPPRCGVFLFANAPSPTRTCADAIAPKPITTRPCKSSRSIPFYAKRGFYFTRRERYDDWLADFRKGAELDPADSGCAFGEGGVYEKLGQHDKAIERYSEAIRKNPKIANYYRERGSAYNYLGKFKLAYADYDKAPALGYPAPFPRETAYSNLGRGYASLQLVEYRREIDDFDAVLKVVPRSSNALAWRGAAYQGLGMVRRRSPTTRQRWRSIRRTNGPGKASPRWASRCRKHCGRPHRADCKAIPVVQRRPHEPLQRHEVGVQRQKTRQQRRHHHLGGAA
jgi:hypothetical protein